VQVEARSDMQTATLSSTARAALRLEGELPSN